MSRRNTLYVYLTLLAVISVVAGLTYQLIDWGIDVAGCKLHRDPGTFLAYCASMQYGDYEHGAYYFDLEPEAIENLTKAQVLFLGGSRAQFGFSTDEVRNYFNERSIPFYLMGFVFDETSEFATVLIEKFNLKPKVLVIDSEPFFTDRLSAPASAILDDSGSFWQRGLRFIRFRREYLQKRQFYRLQSKLCDLRPTLCSEKYGSIYRARKDGSWIWRDLYSSAEGRRFPNDDFHPKVLGPEFLVTVPERARRLFDAAGVRPECVILTPVPNANNDAKSYTVEAGRLLGARVDLPELAGLETIDGSHLTWSSAQRWSGTLMRDIDSSVTRCVFGGAVPDKAQSGSVADPTRPKS
jgi:hypothetical protein